MRTYLLTYIVSISLFSFAFSVPVAVLLPGRPAGRSASGYSSLEYKRQPATIQDQGNLNSVPLPVQQTQNTTSTAGAGDGTNPDAGFITNPISAATPIVQEVDCRNPSTGRANKCWEELKLTQWVEDWVNDNSCYPNEPFASCFLRKEGFPGLDCTGIRPSACTAPQGDNVLTKPEVFNVAYNIYSINQFFLSWWTAVGNAASTASLNLGQIVQLLDPIDDTNAIVNDVLIALTGIFALSPGLSFLAEARGFSTSWIAISQVWENVLVVMPSVGRYLFPKDTIGSQVVQMAALSADMVTIITTVQNNLNATLVSVMQNTAEFLAFASQGNFTESTISLPDETNYLLYAFNTYIISQALNGNNVYGVIGLDSNPQALATNGSKTNWDMSACEGYNEQNVCDAWWYSGRYASAFTLNDFSHMTRNFGDVMTTLFANYTTGELLFDAAYACNANGNYGKPVNVTVNAGGINTACLSQLRIATWDMSCDDPIERSDTPCEFLEVPRQGGFFGSCGSHSFFSVMDDPVYCVPYGYLGPLITQTYTKLKRS